MSVSPDTATNPELLWTPGKLGELLSTPGVAIVDTRPAELFAAGRIPGARHFDPYFVNCDDTDPAPLASFTRMWANMLGWRGVKPTDTIVFYGAFTDMCAARGFWFAEYLGCKNVHVLDGGIKAWVEAGLPTERESAPPQPNKFPFEAVPGRVAAYASILAALDDSTAVILDNRSRDEFIGEDRRARYGGAIPSARHCDWEDLYDHATGRMKPLPVLREIFEALGVTPASEITVYCNTGFRSAHAYLALRLLGYPNVRNYVGSWQEWGNREGLPIVRPG
jgi:thiosulfate/3-mercaptopyruvate sulfurtransferase